MPCKMYIRVYKPLGMKYRTRAIEPMMKKLMAHFPVVAVLGARQVGKSTLVQHLFGSEYEEVVFDPVQDIQQARAEPDLFLANHPNKMFLDEVQYAPELLSAIKRRVDQSTAPGQFILSGSQNLSVIKNISESLSGRVAIVELHGMTAQEMRGQRFELFCVVEVDEWRERGREPFQNNKVTTLVSNHLSRLFTGYNGSTAIATSSFFFELLKNLY